jgi:hypothetical protein
MRGATQGPTGHDFTDNSIVSVAPWFPNTVFVRYSLCDESLVTHAYVCLVIVKVHSCVIC